MSSTSQAIEDEKGEGHFAATLGETTDRSGGPYV